MKALCSVGFASDCMRKDLDLFGGHGLFKMAMACVFLVWSAMPLRAQGSVISAPPKPLVITTPEVERTYGPKDDSSPHLRTTSLYITVTGPDAPVPNTDNRYEVFVAAHGWDIVNPSKTLAVGSLGIDRFTREGSVVQSALLEVVGRDDELQVRDILVEEMNRTFVWQGAQFLTPEVRRQDAMTAAMLSFAVGFIPVVGTVVQTLQAVILTTDAASHTEPEWKKLWAFEDCFSTFTWEHRKKGGVAPRALRFTVVLRPEQPVTSLRFSVSAQVSSPNWTASSDQGWSSTILRHASWELGTLTESARTPLELKSGFMGSTDVNVPGSYNRINGFTVQLSDEDNDVHDRGTMRCSIKNRDANAFSPEYMVLLIPRNTLGIVDPPKASGIISGQQQAYLPESEAFDKYVRASVAWASAVVGVAGDGLKLSNAGRNSAAGTASLAKVSPSARAPLDAVGLGLEAADLELGMINFALDLKRINSLEDLTGQWSIANLYNVYPVPVRSRSMVAEEFQFDIPFHSFGEMPDHVIVGFRGNIQYPPPQWNNRITGMTTYVPQEGVVLLTAIPLKQIPSASSRITGHPAVLFILDNSGSMSEIRTGQNITKLQEAKTAILGLVDEGQSDQAWGGIIYNGCDPVMSIPFTRNRDKLKSSILTIRPGGLTPIAASLDMAYDIVHREEAVTSCVVVLLSDGMQTCQGDPVQSASRYADGTKLFNRLFVNSSFSLVPQAFAVERIKPVTLNVIGFDVELQATQVLQQIAGAASGHYYTAGNLQELQIAIRKAAHLERGGEIVTVLLLMLMLGGVVAAAILVKRRQSTVQFRARTRPD